MQELGSTDLMNEGAIQPAGIRVSDQSFNQAMTNAEGAEENSAEETEVKFIKKIQPPSGTDTKADAKSANRPPRMGGCIPVSG